MKHNERYIVKNSIIDGEYALDIDEISGGYAEECWYGNTIVNTANGAAARGEATHI